MVDPMNREPCDYDYKLDGGYRQCSRPARFVVCQLDSYVLAYACSDHLGKLCSGQGTVSVGELL